MGSYCPAISGKLSPNIVKLSNKSFLSKLREYYLLEKMILKLLKYSKLE